MIALAFIMNGAAIAVRHHSPKPFRVDLRHALRHCLKSSCTASKLSPAHAQGPLQQNALYTFQTRASMITVTNVTGATSGCCVLHSCPCQALQAHITHLCLWQLYVGPCRPTCNVSCLSQAMIKPFFIHSFTRFPFCRSGALQQTFYGSPPACPVLGYSPPKPLWTTSNLQIACTAHLLSLAAVCKPMRSRKQ